MNYIVIFGEKGLPSGLAGQKIDMRADNIDESAKKVVDEYGFFFYRVGQNVAGRTETS